MRFIVSPDVSGGYVECKVCHYASVLGMITTITRREHDGKREGVIRLYVRGGGGYALRRT